MRILTSGEWQDGFLDEHCGPGCVRVRVLAFANLEALRGLYFIRPKSLRMLWNYYRDIGAIGVIRKVASRAKEQNRNAKYLSIGIGEVIETKIRGGFDVGEMVVFLATAHPACMERIVVPSMLVSAMPRDSMPECARDCILHLSASVGEAQWMRQVRGWNPYSGVPLEDAPGVMARTKELCASIDWSKARRLRVESSSPIRERRGPQEQTRSKRPHIVLFGYGNFAKTVVLPNIRRSLKVVGIHEIDPTQIPCGDTSIQWDTAPAPRVNEDYDALFIAGFHHTHAGIAVEALQRGAYAVVEKPLATEWKDCEALCNAVRTRPQLFACFHKRYSPLNELALRDLGVGPGDPVSYHAIVYEVPLPELHWYRWPNSRSRLVSNGCHWIDHFLFLNRYARPVAHALYLCSDGTLNCSIELENGACFSMVLTDCGSERIGVQDYVELRAGRVTVRIANGAEYRAEGPDRIIRQRRINKMRSYEVMYSRIGQSIARGLEGDSLRSLEVSTALMLSLEDELVQLAARGHRCDMTTGARHYGGFGSEDA